MKKFALNLFLLTTLALFVTTQIKAQTGSKIEVLTPKTGQVIYGNRVPVLFSVENFTLREAKAKESPAPTFGHILMWLDDSNPTADSVTKVTAETFTYSDVPFGNHTLKVELVASDNSSFNPPITQTIDFENQAVFTTPAPETTSAFDKNTTLVILIIVAAVIIAAWWYTKDDEEPPEKLKTVPKAKKSKTVTTKSKKSARGKNRK